MQNDWDFLNVSVNESHVLSRLFAVLSLALFFWILGAQPLKSAHSSVVHRAAELMGVGDEKAAKRL